MSSFNASEWGLRHRSVVLFFLLVLTTIGLFSYTRLGQSEDPPFTFKVMVIQTQWPGASAEEVAQQVTDKVEAKLQELSNIDFIRSYSRAGESMVFVIAAEEFESEGLPELWYQVRKRIGDMRGRLPQGIRGPYFNDEFGDTYGNIFALFGEGLDSSALKPYATAVRAELLKIPDVEKVVFFGEEAQRIYIELSNHKLASYGINAGQLMGALSQQNAVSGAGFFETGQERIWLRPSGAFESVEALADSTIRVANRNIRLGDVARVYRGFRDPPSLRLHFNGASAMGIGISMRNGGDIIALGKHIDQAAKRIVQQLPVGVHFERITDQPKAVRDSVNEFVQVLAEAVIVVIGVSLLSLGLRTGVVVLVIIPVVLAITFLFMHYFNIGLHKISLGSLILALGLLVDDAIIAVEMMASKMEQGWDRVRSASFAYVSTAKPMLSGTLVTAAGFLPIATAASSTGEYTRSIFQVTVIALLVSWVAAVLFVPYLGFYLLPDMHKEARQKKKSFWQRVKSVTSKPSSSAPQASASIVEAADSADEDHHDVYNTRFYSALRKVINLCVRFRWSVVILTVVLFVGSLVVFARFVPQQFFPDSTRLELLVDLRLSEGASHHAVEEEVKRLEAFLKAQPGIDNYASWLGGGSPRFYLPLNQQLPQTNFAQLVILTQSIEAREDLRSALIAYFQQQPLSLMGVVNRLEAGPPVGFPVQYRVSGPDPAVIHPIVRQVANVMRTDPHLSNVHSNWGESSKVVRLDIDQDKARALGVSTQNLSQLLKTALQGTQIAEYREGIETIPVVVRGEQGERAALSALDSLAVPLGNGRSVPLSQIAQVRAGFEPGIIWRRDRSPTVTVRGSLYGKTQPATIVKHLKPEIEKLRQSLPLGYHIDLAGTVEKSQQGSESVAAGFPLFIMVVLTILMLQLQRFSLVVMVMLTAPLGIIGVTAFLLLFNQPFGFVAMLGTIALSGMIMRNSVILVDQIRQDLEQGRTPWDAIVESTVRRFRPIMLTAAAAILAMIPLSRSIFFGPMAVSIMGGLVVATLLTVLFLPALYAGWFRVKPPARTEEKVR